LPPWPHLDSRVSHPRTLGDVLDFTINTTMHGKSDVFLMSMDEVKHRSLTSEVSARIQRNLSLCLGHPEKYSEIVELRDLYFTTSVVLRESKGYTKLVAGDGRGKTGTHQSGAT
jgi:hypothetical protein